MNENQNSYRQIVKATSIFGGVQVFQIIIGIIRSKFITVLLGPLGMGISGLLTSTTGFISALTSFGLSTSAVKDISAAHATGNETRLSTVAAVFRKWVWVTGLLGTIITLAFAPWLSQITFGNRNYTWAFILISITLLVNQISAGQGVLLRGMRQIRYMARSGILGSITGLITTVPLYYFFGIKGIVPAIIISSLIALFYTWYYARKLHVKKIHISKARTLAEGKGMLKMGFMVSLSGLISIGASYLVRIYISNTGGVDQVGLYNAGFAIVNTYVGMLFTAMGTDYYPRLSAIAHDNSLCRELINQQAEIALLILAPIIMVFLVFINWVVILLYSTKFIPVNDMILFAALGMFFKAASWSVAFILLAKGESKLFFWNELSANLYVLVLNIAGYKILGLTGMGISFLAAYLLYMIQVYLVAKIKFEFGFTQIFYKIFTFQLLLAIVCLIFVKQLGSPFSYLAGSLIILISGLHAYRELDKRLDMKAVFAAARNRLMNF